MALNYCLIKKNRIYEEIYDMLEDEELNMNNNLQDDKIKYRINKIVNSSKYFTLSSTYSSKEEAFEELMIFITKENTADTMQGNTMLSYADDDNMYELVYLEDLIIEQQDNVLNQFASMSNVEMLPVYGTCGLIKTSYEDGELVNKMIEKEDINKIVMTNFYHTGVMINTDGSMLEIDFSGDKPFMFIGNSFKQLNPINLFGLTTVVYNEEDVTSNINSVASIIYGSELKGRVFFTTLCAITNKKFWNFTKKSINNILRLLDKNITSDDKMNSLNKELMDDKLKNPFFLIKKYSI